MTTYELYINDILCDLSSDEVVTLLYQSPIFSSLDSIQSNRSYNVALPPTPTNMQAIGQAARPDVDAVCAPPGGIVPGRGATVHAGVRRGNGYCGYDQCNAYVGQRG